MSKVLSGEEISGPVMAKDVNCHNFRGLLNYLQKRYGREGVLRAVRGLVDNENYLIADKYDPLKISPIVEMHLRDPAYWVSYGYSLALFDNVKALLEGKSTLFKAGEEAAAEYFSHSAMIVSRVFGFKILAKRVGKINARFNRTKEVTLSSRDRKKRGLFIGRHFQTAG